MYTYRGADDDGDTQKPNALSRLRISPFVCERVYVISMRSYRQEREGIAVGMTQERRGFEHGGEPA